MKSSWESRGVVEATNDRGGTMTQASEQQTGLTQDPSQWVDLFADRLYRYALLRLRDAHAAEEAVQETFLTAVERQEQLREKGTVEGWLIAILRCKIIEWIRRRQRDRRYRKIKGELDRWFDEQGRLRSNSMTRTEPTERLELNELWDIVQDCLKRLPDTLADVFVLHTLENLATEEICRELEITSSNLRVRIYRARLLLADCVSQKWDIPATEDS